MRGHCLCGNVAFEVAQSRLRLYQCHCSLCRRQSGTFSSAATIVPTADFRWLRGLDLVASWQKDTGFRSHFCSGCGSPVPNPLRDTDYYWVPAGLLEEGADAEVAAHFCLASRASWDPSELRGECHDDVPEMAKFIAIVRPEAT